MELTRANAFYNQPNYEKKTKEDLAQKDLLGSPVYTYEDGNSWVRLGKNIVFNGSSIALIYSISKSCIRLCSFGHISLPKLPPKVFWITTALGLYNTVSMIVGCLIHPAAILRRSSPDELSNERRWLSQRGREVKRITIKANGCLLDAMILGRKENLGNGRWIVFSNGNAATYERTNERKLIMADNLNANILLYNYASTGRSEGSFPNRQAILASHRAMLSFLEEEIKATEIIDFAQSIGGGIQGENLKTYPLKNGVKYVFVKYMTFATLSQLVEESIGKVGAVALKGLNWEYSSVESSKALSHPEIIIQQSNQEKMKGGYVEMTNINQLSKTDGVIKGEVSLAKTLFQDPSCPKENKVFMLVREGHNERFFGIHKFSQMIQKQLD